MAPTTATGGMTGATGATTATLGRWTSMPRISRRDARLNAAAHDAVAGAVRRAAADDDDDDVTLSPFQNIGADARAVLRGPVHRLRSVAQHPAIRRALKRFGGYVEVVDCGDSDDDGVATITLKRRRAKKYGKLGLVLVVAGGAVFVCAGLLCLARLAERGRLGSVGAWLVSLV